MTQEQFRLSESGNLHAKLEKAIGAYENLVFKAEQDPNPKNEQQLHDLMNGANNVFRSNTGKWPKGLIEDTYALIKRVGIISAGYDEATGVKFVRLSAAILLNHLAINDENRPLVHVLLYDKTNFNFVREIKYEWLGAKGMAKLEKVGAKLYELAGTLSEGHFNNTFAGLTESGFNAYVDEILNIDSKAENRTTDSKSKILLGLIQYFHSGLIPNINVSIENKKKVLEFNKTVLDKVPGLFAEKRVALAEGVGIGLKDAKKGKRKSKSIDARLASERLSQKEHEYVSVASITPDEVVVFDYNESNEKVLAMPEVMKIQLNSLALIGDLAAGYWNHEGGEKGVQQGQFAIQAIDKVQKNIVDYYRNEKYDGKTPFKFAEGLKAAMSIKAFGEIKSLAYSSRINDVPFRSALLNLVDGKALQNMDEVKEAGLAVAWLQRNKFDDFMSARGLMSKLLHKDVMTARENLPEDVQKKLYGDAYTDAGRFMRNLLADGDHMNTFKQNFPKGFIDKFGRSPTETEIDEGAKGHLNALFESQHMFLYDAYLTWAALSRKYIDTSKMSGVDKRIYEEFCKSVDPDGGTFRLDDRAKATLYPMMKEIAIMALSFGAAWAVSSLARVGIGLVRGASLFQKTTTLAKLAKYSAEAAMFTGKVAAEAGAFYDVDAALHGKDTIIETALAGDKWKATKMLASDMPMFAGFNIAGGILKFLKMGAEGRVLMKYAAKNTQHSKAIEGIFALAKNSPTQAVEVMKDLIRNGGKLAEVKGLKLGKGVLPQEVLESFGRSVKDIELMAQQYRGIIGKISDPRVREIVGKLVVELNFDAAAIMIGEAAKHGILPSEDVPKVEATLFDHYKSAYLTAGVFKAVFGGLGKLAEKLPAAVEKALPKAMRERIFKSYRNAKGEFIGRDGLVQMLTGGLEGEGFESAIVKIEQASDLILTAQDVLLVTSKLPKNKRTKFLQACARIMKPGEKQLFLDTVNTMEISKSDIPKDFTESEAPKGKVNPSLDPFRRQTMALRYWLHAQIIGAAVRAFTPEADSRPIEDRPVAEATVKSGDFLESGRFNFSKERVSKMPNASEKSKVTLINSDAKNASESMKDFSEFDFSISQNSIFEGMAKAGVDIKNINELKAAYAALPAFLQPYYRIFGSNVDGQFVSNVAIDQKGFTNEMGYDSKTGEMNPEKNIKLAGALDVDPQLLQEAVSKYDMTFNEKAFLIYLIFAYAYAFLVRPELAATNEFKSNKWGILLKILLGWGFPITDGLRLSIRKLFGKKDSHAEGGHHDKKAEGHGAEKHKAATLKEILQGTVKEDNFKLTEDNLKKLEDFHKDISNVAKSLEFKTPEDKDVFIELFVKWKHAKLRLSEVNGTIADAGNKLATAEAKIRAFDPLWDSTLDAKQKLKMLGELKLQKTDEAEAVTSRQNRTPEEDAKIINLRRQIRDIDALEKILKDLSTLPQEQKKLSAILEDEDNRFLRVLFEITKVKDKNALKQKVTKILKDEGMGSGEIRELLKSLEELVTVIEKNKDPGNIFRQRDELLARKKLLEKTDAVRGHRNHEEYDQIQQQFENIRAQFEAAQYRINYDGVDQNSAEFKKDYPNFSTWMRWNDYLNNYHGSNPTKADLLIVQDYEYVLEKLANLHIGAMRTVQDSLGRHKKKLIWGVILTVLACAGYKGIDLYEYLTHEQTPEEKEEEERRKAQEAEKAAEAARAKAKSDPVNQAGTESATQAGGGAGKFIEMQRKAQAEADRKKKEEDAGKKKGGDAPAAGEGVPPAADETVPPATGEGSGTKGKMDLKTLRERIRQKIKDKESEN